MMSASATGANIGAGERSMRFWRAARVANAALDGWLPDHAVAVEGRRIRDVLPADQAPAEQTIDLGDVSLLPGLIEAHTHIPCPPRVDAFDIISEEPAQRGLLRAAAAVGTALRSGVTTMRDLGARNDVVFAIREAIADGVIPGPRLLAAGAPITRTRDHCWFWGGEADSPEEVAAMARRHIEDGADLLKVMASGGNFTPSSSPRSLQYPGEVLAVIVEAADAAGLDVAAHAHAASGIRAAVEAGVRHLIHCSWLAAEADGGLAYDPQLAARIADEGIWVNPTIGLGLLAAEARTRGDAPPRRNPSMRGNAPTREQRLEVFRDMHARGVRFTSGLDMGMAYADFDRAPAEAWAFVEEIGFSPWQAIRLMTSQTAEALGIGDQVGSIARGKVADLAAFAGDPAADVRALNAPVCVIQSGGFVVGSAGVV